MLARPELSPFFGGIHGGNDDLNDFRIFDLNSSADGIPEIHKLARKAFGKEAMDLAAIGKLHGGSATSVFVLKGGRSNEALGYFSMFFPAPGTIESMLSGEIDIDNWKPSDFLPSERLAESKCVYLESIVVLDPDSLQRKIKSRILQRHAVRFLSAEMAKQNIEGPLLFLGYSAPTGGKEPGANLMTGRLKMKIVPKAGAHGWKLYRGDVLKSDLMEYEHRLDVELFHLQALSKLKRQD